MDWAERLLSGSTKQVTLFLLSCQVTGLLPWIYQRYLTLLMLEWLPKTFFPASNDSYRIKYFSSGYFAYYTVEVHACCLHCLLLAPT